MCAVGYEPDDRGGNAMKIPLHYQRTEYDCGPTSLLNTISFLFQREEIPPDILRYTLSPEGYYLPELTMPDEPEYEIRRFGYMRHQ